MEAARSLKVCCMRCNKKSADVSAGPVSSRTVDGEIYTSGVGREYTSINTGHADLIKISERGGGSTTVGVPLAL